MSSSGILIKVFELTKKIPRGKVTTYGEIARALNKSKAGRAVGNALNKNNSLAIPRHRVIKSDGYVGGYQRGTKQKALIFNKEGIKIGKSNKIALKKYLFRFL